MSQDVIRHEEPKARVTVTLDSSVLRALDARCQELSRDRSPLVNEILRSWLDAGAEPSADSAVGGTVEAVSFSPIPLEGVSDDQKYVRDLEASWPGLSLKVRNLHWVRVMESGSDWLKEKIRQISAFITFGGET